MKQKWPDIKVDDYSATIDFIIKFYQELGWNLVEAIDPRKIVSVKMAVPFSFFSLVR
ncbi:MAG: hypothetical protein ACOX53_08435 [Limnochordia bacterium]